MERLIEVVPSRPRLLALIELRPYRTLTPGPSLAQSAGNSSFICDEPEFAIYSHGTGAMRFLFAGTLIMMIYGATLGLHLAPLAAGNQAADAKPAPATDPDRAFGYLAKICALGPRISGTEGMDRQQQLIADHFTKLKAQVKYQSFDAPHPSTRTPVRMNNMIVSWNPDAGDRVLLACHYDTRPHADRDPNEH